MSALEQVSSIEKHLLASYTTPPEVVVNAIANSSRNGLPVLDIGAGDGRLVSTVKKYLPFSPVVTLDRDTNVLAALNGQFAGALRVYGNAFKLPFRNQLFGLALSVNTAHEVCGSQDKKDRLDKFHEFVNEVTRTLQKDGEFIFYDGIMPETSEELIDFRPLSPDALKNFQQFSNSYTGQDLSIQRLSGYQFRLPMADLVCFLTKLPYINGRYWEDERTQLYPFLSQREILDVLSRLGLQVQTINYPTQRSGLVRFLESYSISNYDLESFPPVQIAVKAKLY